MISKEQADFEAHWKWPFHPVAGCAGARGATALDTKIRRLWCLCTYKLTSVHFSITSPTTCFYLFLKTTRLNMLLLQFSQKNLRFSTAANLWEFPVHAPKEIKQIQDEKIFFKTNTNWPSLRSFTLGYYGNKLKYLLNHLQLTSKVSGSQKSS